MTMRVIWFILVEMTLLYVVSLALNLFLLRGYNMMIDYYFMMSRLLILATLCAKPVLYLVVFLVSRELTLARIQKISKYTAHGRV